MEDNKFPTAFAVKHKNDSVREKSSSGGVFTAVSEIILKSSGVVIGAGLMRILWLNIKFAIMLNLLMN